MALEQLLEEFFHPNTSNIRKYEIEIQLNNFKSIPNLWQLCLYFVQHTSSQYVTMFALSTLEVIHKLRELHIHLLIFSLQISL